MVSSCTFVHVSSTRRQVLRGDQPQIGGHHVTGLQDDDIPTHHVDLGSFTLVPFVRSVQKKTHAASDRAVSLGIACVFPCFSRACFPSTIGCNVSDLKLKPCSSKNLHIPLLTQPARHIRANSSPAQLGPHSASLRHRGDAHLLTTPQHRDFGLRELRQRIQRVARLVLLRAAAGRSGPLLGRRSGQRTRIGALRRVVWGGWNSFKLEVGGTEQVLALQRN